MLNRAVITKSWSFVPRITAQRSRVRILPKEYYDDDETPFMKARKPRKTMFTDFLAVVQRHNWKFADVKNYFKWKYVEGMRKDQRYLPNRHRVLGPDLATAQFFAFRGGKIKFLGSEEWVTDKDIGSERLPSSYQENFIVEELDASGLDLCYEGFENLCNLRGLKKLILKNCPNVDDFCLSRSYLFQNSLEYLDISGCENVTERGICTLHVLRKLKTLVLNDTPNIQNKELVCLLLQDIIPNCDVVGVDYDDPVLLQRVKMYLN